LWHRSPIVGIRIQAIEDKFFNGFLFFLFTLTDGLSLIAGLRKLIAGYLSMIGLRNRGAGPTAEGARIVKS
jgi:hypothetical protein